MEGEREGERREGEREGENGPGLPFCLTICYFLNENKTDFYETIADTKWFPFDWAMYV